MAGGGFAGRKEGGAPQGATCTVRIRGSRAALAPGGRPLAWTELEFAHFRGPHLYLFSVSAAPSGGYTSEGGGGTLEVSGKGGGIHLLGGTLIAYLSV